MDDRNNRYGPYGPTGYNDSGTPGDYGRDYGSGRDYTYSSARDYAAAGELGRGRDRSQRDDWNRGRNQDRSTYGAQGYGQRNQERSGWDGSSNDWSDTGSRSYSNYGAYSAQDRDRDYGQRGYGNSNSDSRDSYARSYGQQNQDRARYGRQDQGRSYGYDRNRGEDLRGYDRDRGFLDRAGDEVRSWFGDEEAERRRRQDQRYDEQQARNEGASDSHYGEWRRSRLQEFDRDYDEYRRENAQRFHSEFETFRTERTGQRDSLRRVTEHMEVLGSDGSHVGTVDKVRGDRIILTKNDTDAEGRHHSIPSRWIQTVDDKVTLRKTADEAKNHWRDEEQSGAMFGEDKSKSTATTTGQTGTGERSQDWNTTGNLNASFKGTY
jgi:osmotically-inducible protein OsmY